MEKEPLLPSSSLNQHKSNFENPILIEPKRKLHRSKSTPSSSITPFNNLENHLAPIPNPPHFLKNTTILKQVILLLFLYLTIGVSICFFFMDQFKTKKTHPIVDALYFCILTMCTIGYSDITPNSTLTKLFSILFVLVSLGFYHILLTNFVIYILDSRKNTHKRLFDTQKSSKVLLALCIFVVCIGIGVFLMHFVEKIGWFDSFYFSFMGVTSVGYGAKVFESIVGRIFGSIWLVVSIIVVIRVFILFVEVRVDERQRKVDKWVMEQDMTVDQFHDGFVSKSDYMIYKLKELGKITERDILLINKQFERFLI
ncbi:two-pore potassium channel 3-like [Solanum stenotomum]|uniref:two-pore potassium channel 3-like n=1 Tax=Solanum stenotomum TaxID=172797 RepID=UPI0020D08823|nr:two-pore potassium channel 3-like [Solanum stenotomum]